MIFVIYPSILQDLHDLIGGLKFHFWTPTIFWGVPDFICGRSFTSLLPPERPIQKYDEVNAHRRVTNNLARFFSQGVLWKTRTWPVNVLWPRFFLEILTAPTPFACSITQRGGTQRMSDILTTLEVWFAKGPSIYDVRKIFGILATPPVPILRNLSVLFVLKIN